MDIPHLRKQGNATQLVVRGEPFLILGGELGNSAASSPAALDAIWPRLIALGLNTVLLPVTWELSEPEEGRFDFSLCDCAIDGARKYGLRLVLLWFGSWKNSMSCYVPAWVKRDQVRFPRAERTQGADHQRLEILSAFYDENLRADARAFAALMRHVRERDAREGTVVMVQVENEVGMLEEAAERGAAARAAFAAPVPARLLEVVARQAERSPALWGAWRNAGQRASGTWAEVFGEGDAADEIFTAWHYARYVDGVASAGKREHALPMFVNAALNRPNRRPGEYPSGGPLPHLLEVWRAGAPAIDFFSPDIYFPDFARWCRAYARPDNPLFIPEIASRPEAAVQVLHAIGRYDAIGFSPFAIDSIEEESATPLAASYAALAGLAPLILENQGHGRTAGILLDGDDPRAEVRLGDFVLTLRHDYTWEWASPARLTRPWPRAGALVLATGPGEYLVAGDGVIVTFAPVGPGPSNVGILGVDEGHVDRGRFVPGRRLNGDETHQGRHLRLPAGTVGVQRLRLYRY